MICGFCQAGRHESCPGATRNGNGSLNHCKCKAHTIEVRCLDCGTPGEWKCADPLHCAGTISRQTAASPLYQILRDCQEDGRRERMERYR